MAGLMLAMFLSALEQTIIAPALAAIGRSLDDFENLSWVVTAYLLELASPFALSLGSIAGAIGALGLLLALSGPRAETSTLLLAGLAISALAGALTTLALALAPSPFAFYDAYEWLMGSLVDRSLAQAAFALVPAAISILLLWRQVPALDSLALEVRLQARLKFARADDVLDVRRGAKPLNYPACLIPQRRSA